LLSSVAARNLAAPQVALPQDNEVVIPEIWGVFLDTMCTSDAREKLKIYQSDPIALGEEAFNDFMAQAKPEALERMATKLGEEMLSMGEMPVEDYIVMLKADVKPTLSIKPLSLRTEPQVIVYHDKLLSGLYSSIFRMLTRRFLSLIRHNVHVNLLKDNRDIASLIRTLPFDREGVQYLENDFSKYDKSQGEFAAQLEEYVFAQLGMNAELLDKWTSGHLLTTMRSLVTGLRLKVIYQRKSGDATTAFGNVLLNILSVAYAYQGTQYLWAVFMGDDSLVAATTVATPEVAVQRLAEIFNLSAKFYLTDAPYFASNFVEIDRINRVIELLPDPIKRIEKLSMHVSAEDPQWEERFRSAQDTLDVYRYVMNTKGLAQSVTKRYDVKYDLAEKLPSAIATLISDFKTFRNIWEAEPTVSHY